MKKIIAIIMVLALAIGMTACGGGTAEEGSGEDAYTIGVCQLLEHPALDSATQGFCDAVTAALGDSVSFDIQSAQGETNNCTTIINNFVAADVDLILANATGALQAAVSGTDTIPILGTSVSSYDAALGIETEGNLVGGNVSGTSDLPPIDEQAAMLMDIFPDTKTVGVLYCSSEANSAYQVRVIKAELESYGVTVNDYAFSDTNDIASVLNSAIADSDVIYLPSDNVVANNVTLIDNICRPAGIPCVCGEETICAGCGTVTLTLDYYDLGYATGEMAVEILANGADISTMPFQFAPQFTKKYNADICGELGIAIPDDFVTIE